MNKILRYSLLMVLAIVGMGNAWADTSTLTFAAKANGTGTASDGAVWTISSDAEETTFDSDRGIHFGTNNKEVSHITLTTSGISGTISSIVVNAAAASTATVSVTVGGEAFGGDAQSLTSSAADYPFTGSASGEIVVKVAKPQSAKKALYVKSVVVTYVSSDTRIATSIEFETTPVTRHSAGKDGNYTLPKATVTALGSTLADVTPTWSLTTSGWREDSEAPTISEGKVIIPNRSYGKITLTAAFDGNNQFKSCSKSFTLTVYRAAQTVTELWEWFNNGKVTDAGFPVSYWPVDGNESSFTLREDVIVYANGSRTFLADFSESSSGLYSILLFGSNLGLKTGDKISITGADIDQGIYGTLKTYSGLLELEVDYMGATKVDENYGTKPLFFSETMLNNMDGVFQTIGGKDFKYNNAFVNSKVQIAEAVYQGVPDNATSSNKTYNFKVGTTDLVVYDQFSCSDIANLEVGATYFLTGMGGINKSKYQLLPLSAEKTAEPAGINNIKAAKTANAVRYNLAGQKVNAGYKGVVIMNGNKVVVK